VGRRGLLGPALASLALLIAGCGGGDGPTLTFDGTDEEQIAATVNTMTAAIAAGEGAVACELMTDRGQQAMIRFGRQVFDTEGVDSCEQAVPVVADAGYDPGDFRVTVRDVSIEPGTDRAQVNCEFRGGFLLLHTSDGWRVNIPYCFD
jgi:hypothetical protein